MEQAMFFTSPITTPLEPVEEKVDWGIGVNLSVRLLRLPRQRCTVCQQRRVCFVLAVESVNGELKGPPVCAEHAGVRSERSGK